MDLTNFQLANWQHIAIDGVLIAAFALVAFVVWIRVLRALKRGRTKDEQQWGAMVLDSLGTPVTVLILLLGLQQIGELLAGLFPQYESGEFFSVVRPLILLVVLFWVLLRLVGGAERLYRRQKKLTIGEKEVDSNTMYVIFRVLRGTLFIVAVLTAMSSMGVSISGILAFGGFGGMIVGFAAKDTLSNFFSGLLIFWERPFVVGDWIRRPDANLEGVVENIGWRMTQIRTFDQRPLYVPNSLFFNGVIENPQRMTNRRIYEYMGLRYDDIEKLPEVLNDIRQMLRQHSGIDQTKICMVNFDRYGSSSLDFFIYAMTKTTNWEEFQNTKEDILLQIAAIVARRQCEFAFPTRTLHHIGGASAALPRLPQ